MEVEQDTSDLEDVRELHPTVLLYKASKARNLPVMAEALAHGADVNSINEEDEGKSPLIQAVTGVSRPRHFEYKHIPNPVLSFLYIMSFCLSFPSAFFNSLRIPATEWS